MAAGSGLLQSQLFDWFAANVNSPALFFGLRCAVRPKAMLHPEPLIYGKRTSFFLFFSTDASAAPLSPSSQNHRCTRASDPGTFVCCHSGGFIASGQVSPDKTPQPFLPTGVQPIENEGAARGAWDVIAQRVYPSFTPLSHSLFSRLRRSADAALPCRGGCALPLSR